jgi:hypothetical protein
MSEGNKMLERIDIYENTIIPDIRPSELLLFLRHLQDTMDTSKDNERDMMIEISGIIINKIDEIEKKEGKDNT